MNENDFDDELNDHLLAYAEQRDGSVGTVHAAPDESRLSIAARERLDQAKHCLDVLFAMRADESTESSSASGEEPAPRGEGSNLPRQVGRFRILDQLGVGGFGIVYRAWDPRTRREVALKVPRIEVLASDELRQRFEQEAQAAARLEHQNLVSVFEAGTDGLLPYIVSAYYPGVTLTESLKQHGLAVPPAVAARWTAQLAQAVAHAHERGVLHRDIKPSNILLVGASRRSREEQDADAWLPKLMDFGLAKLAAVEQDMTRSGALLGTLRYMSPEQATGRIREIGPASDVYGLGAVLYELLTGRAPFVADSDVEVLRQISSEEPSGVRRLRPDIPRDLDTICQKCLEKEPARRYSTAQALADDLGRHLRGEPILARSVSTLERGAKWAKRNPLWATLWGVITISLAGIIGALAWSNIVVTRERKHATTSEHLAKEQARVAREYAYAADMRLAQEAWERSTPDEALTLLERYRPRPGEADLRGIEWHYLWNSAHRYSQVIARQPSPVWSMAVSPDEKTLITGARDGMLRVWSLESNQLLRELRGDDVGDINAVTMKPDGKEMYAAGDDHKIRVWRTDNWQVQTVLEGHANWIGGLALSPRCEWLASGDADGRVMLWNLEHNQLEHELYRQKTAIKCIVFHPRNPWVVSFSEGGDTRIWDFVENRPPHEFPEGRLDSPESVWHGVFLPDGRWLYGCGDNKLIVWGFRPGHYGKCNQFLAWGASIAISPAGKWLFSGGFVGNADVYVRSIAELNDRPLVMHGHSDGVRALAPLSDEKTIFSGSDDGTIRRWQYRLTDPNHVTQCMGVSIESLAWSPTRDLLLVGLHGGEVVVTDSQIGTEPRSLGRQTHSACGLTFAADGHRFVSIDGFGEVWWGDLEVGLAKQPAYRIAEDASQVCLDCSDRTLLYTQVNNLIAVDATTGEARWRFEHPSRVSALARRGEDILTACHDGCLRSFDPLTGKLRRQTANYKGYLHSLHVSPEASKLLIACQDKTLRVLDAETFEEQRSLPHTAIRQALFIEGGRRLLAIDQQHLSILNPNTGQLMLKFPKEVDERVWAINRDCTILAIRERLDHLTILRLKTE